ncbi:MAG: hypothetical protein A3F84_25705 [Candidatus Handelsmanbacteria bacterium RIFCSPLOWO2_12_FULL_64_10]|uniref:Uncharacterized protein n=1 Tax=Handelsmanbacteria sp. (strain RIFCSPLOWO2_12_FULL_64_10) TaxID=1817868 RepID=A0A1F6CB18_HANXR|nr:MAG: hypothetical protein A3F84_25705 [Candidatus Handelsmanbacteria bacterium RIFCSPLOWO2_12_FULL_64_10]
MRSSSPDVPVATMVKRHEGATYLFAVGMRDGQTRATFTVSGVPSNAMAEALGEGRRLPLREGTFDDDFEPYGVHLYRIRVNRQDSADNNL